ncbi:hypothetical protein ACKKBF_B13745 [Auxenochlorella protothecoides x Auxenochlorella symbiontica]
MLSQAFHAGLTATVLPPSRHRCHVRHAVPRRISARRLHAVRVRSEQPPITTPPPTPEPQPRSIPAHEPGLPPITAPGPNEPQPGSLPGHEPGPPSVPNPIPGAPGSQPGPGAPGVPGT